MWPNMIRELFLFNVVLDVECPTNRYVGIFIELYVGIDDFITWKMK